MSIKTRIKAELALCVDTLIWGLSFPVIKILLEEVNPQNLVFLRSVIATIIFLPFVFFSNQNRKNFFKLMPIGAVLGLLYYISYLTQTIGLQKIPSGRSAFITSLSVVFVPLLSPLFKQGYPKKKDIISMILALIGIFFLTDPFVSKGFSIGDSWTIICSLSFSIQILLLQLVIKKYKFYMLISFFHIFFIMIFSSLSVFSHHSSIHIPHTLNGYYSLFYLSILAMFVTTFLQNRFQHETTAERASIIYALEPVFASIFGYTLLNENQSLLNILGGGLVIMSVLWPIFFNLLTFRKKKD